MNGQLSEWRDRGHFVKTSSQVPRKSTFCGSQISYMVCIYLYPLCDDGVPLALCQDQCSNLRSQCCDAANNLTLLVANLDNGSPLHLLCDYDDVDVAGNLYPYPAGDPSCYALQSTYVTHVFDSCAFIYPLFYYYVAMVTECLNVYFMHRSSSNI